jgi:RNA polymerase sigma-70 factor (ECF subfamily)
MAFLVLLEQLSPIERAVFLLREVFEYDYGEIATIVGKSEDKPTARGPGRRHVEAGKPRFEASREQRDKLARRFFAAVAVGDTEAIAELLAPDVVLYGDGGGQAPAIPRPIFGREHVGRVLAGWIRQGKRASLTAERVEVNEQPGARFLTPDGRLVTVVSLDIADGLVQAVRSIVNPDKLGHLGPLADLRELLRQS